MDQYEAKCRSESPSLLKEELLGFLLNSKFYISSSMVLKLWTTFL